MTTTTAPPAPATGERPDDRPLRRLERAALGGVIFRERTMFRRYWPSTTFSSIVEPTIYLLAFGLGFGAVIPEIGGYEYIEFVGTGVVATAILFSSTFPAMFGTFVKRKFQKSYDAILAAPVDTEEVVTAEALWLALRAGVYGIAPLVVAVAFGLRPGPGVVVVPLIGILTGFGFACLGVWISGIVSSIDSFNYVISALLTPLFLVAGTFFPVDNLGTWAPTAALLNPLYHCVELVRHAVFGFEPLTDLGHVAALTVFAVVMWRLAIARLEARLVD